MERGGVGELCWARNWDAALERLATDEGRREASEKAGMWLPLHRAVVRDAPVEVVRALLDAYPEGAGMTDNMFGCLPLHNAAERAPVVEVVRALLDAHPRAANIQDNFGNTPGRMSYSDDHPKVHVMLALARAGHPPNHPWTTRTHSVLHQIAASVPDTAASALIDAHVLRVRTLLCTLHRHGIPFALVSSIVGKVYVSDFFE